MFDKRLNEIIAQIDRAHRAYYEAETFGGPSLHFHLRALDASRERDFAGFAESAYAMLASWGMHRMGPKGAKMCEFNRFEESIDQAWPIILDLQAVDVVDIKEEHWTKLECIFSTLDVMQSGTSIVGKSKVMAHALPNLVAPVDRQYTLRLLYETTSLKNDEALEWKKLRELLQHFFRPQSTGMD